MYYQSWNHTTLLSINCTFGKWFRFLYWYEFLKTSPTLRNWFVQNGKNVCCNVPESNILISSEMRGHPGVKAIKRVRKTSHSGQIQKERWDIEQQFALHLVLTGRVLLRRESWLDESGNWTSSNAVGDNSTRACCTDNCHGNRLAQGSEGLDFISVPTKMRKQLYHEPIIKLWTLCKQLLVCDFTFNRSSL